LSSDPLILAAVRAVARDPDPDTTLAELLEIALRIAGAERAAAFLWDADQGELAVAGARGLPPDDLPSWQTAARAPEHPIYLAAHERLQTSRPVDPGVEPGRTIAAWPLVVGRDGIEEPIGALALEGPEPTDAEANERLATVADLIALAVDRARLASDLGERSEWNERIGNTDLLTGLANARTLSRVIELEIARAARQGSPLTVAIFDVDGLTSINATAGRAAGDDVLREVAAVVAESVRFVDTVARWGGDEFILVAPGASGTTVVHRIVEAVAGRPAIRGRTFSVSAGLARFPGDGTTGDDLISAATAALQATRAIGPGTLAEATQQAADSTA
jgi:diguanylate cyclase (GGDEF)-like protein